MDGQRDFLVFLSYSHSDALMQNAVATTINQISGVKVWIDSDAISYGETIHPNIEKGLKESDCVLVILTENSIISFEVREEVVRAHERQIPILALKEAKVTRDSLPHFLRDMAFIEYDQANQRDLRLPLRDLRDRITAMVNKAVSTKLASASKDLLEMSKTLQAKSDTELFRAEIVSSVIERTREEIKGVLGQRYNIDIGLERAFLIRATPLFQNADKIYAISYDKISTFWKNQSLNAIARDYLKNHKPYTIRLFVFSTPLEAQRYLKILDTHAEHYNKEGAVLVCSSESYTRIVHEVVNDKSKSSALLTEDFGVLAFGDRIVEATLSETSLKFRFIKETLTTLINHRRIMEVMEGLRSLPQGEIDPQYNVLRWHPDLLNFKEKWAEKLMKLFPHPTRDTLHMVFFTRKNGGAEARNKIAEIKDKLANLDYQIRPKEIWFGKLTYVDATDNQYRAALKAGTDYPYALLMKHDSMTQLQDYQNTLEHSKIRHELYAGFDDKIQNLYHFIEGLNNHDERRRKLFEVIEDLVGDYMVRMDYVDDTEISSIVKEPWYAF
jgi:hypothetical protein